MTLLGVAVAGALGALARMAMGTRTFIVNVSGSFVLGLIVGFALYHGFGTTPRAVLGTGFCGAYTTFSTWWWETLDLADHGQRRAAVGNALWSVAAGTAAAGLGLAIAAL